MSEERAIVAEKTAEGSNRVRTSLAASLVSDAVFLAGLTLLGYMVAFVYLRGQADALGIPPELISVSLETCLVVFVLLIGWIGILVVILDAMMASIPERFQGRFSNTVALGLSGLVATLVGGAFISRGYYLFTALFVVVLTNFFVRPLFTRADGGTYMDRLKAIFDARGKIADQRRPMKWIENRVGQAPVLLFLLIFSLSTTVGYVFGKVTAEFKLYYFVTLTHSPDILVARYGDMLVFRRNAVPEIVIRVIGKDEIPPLVIRRTGSMAVIQ